MAKINPFIRQFLPTLRSSEGAGTTTLTSGDSRWQIFNLSAARTCVLPSISIKKNDLITLENLTDFLLTVQASNLSEITTAAGATGNMGRASIFKGKVQLVAIQDTPTTPAHWLTVDVVEGGIYTPTLTNGANVASSTPFPAVWTRNGRVVDVAGHMAIDPTTGAATSTIVDISLPVTSNFTTEDDLAGVGAVSLVGGTSYDAAYLNASDTNDRAVYFINISDAATRQHRYSFQYVLK